MLKKIFKITFSILKLALLWCIIILLILVLAQGIKFLLQIFIHVLKLSSLPISDLKSQTLLESTINSANFTLVYITALFTIMGILVTIMSIWWSSKISILGKCHRDYENFRKSFPLETQLTTAKIFFLQKKYSEAWDYIKDLPENFSYEIPLYKAGILMGQPHTKSVFPSAMSFLNKALAFSVLSKESKSLIYRYIGIAYLEEKNDFTKAAEFAEKAIIENPTFWSAYIVKGRALKRLRLLHEAIEILERVIAEDTTYEVAYFNLACYYSLVASEETNLDKQLELKNKAIEYYKISIKLNNDNKKIARTDSDLIFIKNNIRNL